MTTVCLKDGVMASDGQSTIGDMITDLNVQKVFNINNCLVGFAGRMTSGLEFLDWFEEWSTAHLVQAEMPDVNIMIPKDFEDEEFTALVLWSDGSVAVYEGGKRTYEVDPSNGVAIGSGACYALAAMDAGASAEEAVRIAIGRDVFSGGEVFVVQQEEEEEPLTREAAEEMDKEDLLDLIFGKNDGNAEIEATQEAPPVVDLSLEPISKGRILGPTEYEIEKEFIKEQNKDA